MSVNELIFDAVNYPDPGSFFAFDDIIGDLQPKQAEAQVIERFGSDGETVRLLATRAANSQAVFIRYFVDRDTAVAAVASYVNTLITGEPYELIQHGTSFGFFKVLRIEPQMVRPCIVAGALTTGSTVGLFMRFTLRNAFDPTP